MRKKMEVKACKMMFVGYSKQYNAYCFLDKDSERIKISLDVRFVEHMEFGLPQVSQRAPAKQVEDTNSMVELEPLPKTINRPNSDEEEYFHGRKFPGKEEACAQEACRARVYPATPSTPVVQKFALHVLRTVAGRCNWIVKDLDVKSAYLYGTLTEEIFMRLPPGFSVKGKDHQAARVWYRTISDILTGIGFEQSKADSCLYWKQLRCGDWVYMMIYVAP